MKRARVVFAASLLTLNTHPLPAQNGSGWIFGYGTQSCGKWLAARHGPEFYSYTGWIQGFLSALALFMPIQKVDSDALAAWVDNYCSQNPLKTIKDAAQQLSIELIPVQPDAKK